MNYESLDVINTEPVFHYLGSVSFFDLLIGALLFLLFQRGSPGVINFGRPTSGFQLHWL